MVCDPDSEFPGMIPFMGKIQRFEEDEFIREHATKDTQFFRQSQMFNISFTFFGLFGVMNENNNSIKEKTKEIFLLFLLNSVYKGPNLQH